MSGLRTTRISVVLWLLAVCLGQADSHAAPRDDGLRSDAPRSDTPRSDTAAAWQLIDDFHECARLIPRGEACRTPTSIASLQGFLDLQAIAERILGARWTTASASERSRFADLIGQIVERQMIERFGDRSVIIDEARSLKNGDKVVVGRFVSRDDTMSRLTWRLNGPDHRILIQDVSIDGTSSVIAARDRIQGLSVYTEGTIDSLIVFLRERYLQARPPA